MEEKEELRITINEQERAIEALANDARADERALEEAQSELEKLQGDLSDTTNKLTTAERELLKTRTELEAELEALKGQAGRAATLGSGTRHATNQDFRTSWRH